MFNKILSFLLFTVIGIHTFAQNQDSLILVKTKWHKTKISRNVKLFQFHFNQKNLFAANENISYVEVKNSGRKAYFALGANEKELITTSSFGLKDSAIVAINGNFFDVKNGGSVDFVKVNNQIINQNRLEKGEKRARHQQAAIVIDEGKLAIKKWDETADWETKLSEKNVLLNGPLLTFNGVNEELDTAAFNSLRHPRTCLGIKPNGRVILLTVDGRNDNSAGMSLFELTKLMKWLGCTSSINFDGGGSTTLWVQGFQEGGVINYPTDNKKWDHAGQRKVANVVLIKKK